MQLTEVLLAIAVIVIGVAGASIFSLGRRAASDLFYLRLQISELKAEFKAQMSEVGKRIVNLEQGQPAISDMVRATERTVSQLQDALAALTLDAGAVHSPSEIVIGPADTYENLDQNWQSLRDTTGKVPVENAIEGPRDRTAVIVTLGQSNAANHGSGRYVAKQAVYNFNIYDGRCYQAADPLLGASGDGGNFATRLGDMLIERGQFERVIVAPIGMGGTTVEQWAIDGMFNRRIIVLIRRLYDAGLTPDFILWHQGEGNTGVGDKGGRQYRKNLLEVVKTFRQYGIKAPFFIALAHVSGPHEHPNADNVRGGQRGAVNPLIGTYLGPDTDEIGIENRWDQCHFAETGLTYHAAMWAGVLERFLRPPAHASVVRPPNPEMAATQ